MEETQATPVRVLRGDNFSVDEMYKMSQRNNQTWGVEGYEVPVINHDYQKMMRERKYFEGLNSKKKKAKVPRSKTVDPKAAKKEFGRGIFHMIEKTSGPLPGPWQYHQEPVWLTGHGAKPFKEIPSKNIQSLEMDWTGIKKDARTFTKAEKRKIDKLDPKKFPSKNTFIDQIIHINSKKGYPTPSPASYHLTEKAAKAYKKLIDKESAAKFDENKFKPLKQKKGNGDFSKSDRKFILINEKNVVQMPKENFFKEPKPKEVMLNYKVYDKKRKEDKERIKAAEKRKKDYESEILEKIGAKLPKYPVPIPADIDTFEKISQIYSSKKKISKPIFGSADRFALPPTQKWAETVKKHNAASVNGLRTLDPKRDPVPGPAHYNLTAAWKGKPPRKKEKKVELGNIFDVMTKGPAINVYNQH